MNQGLLKLATHFHECEVMGQWDTDTQRKEFNHILRALDTGEQWLGPSKFSLVTEIFPEILQYSSYKVNYYHKLGPFKNTKIQIIFNSNLKLDLKNHDSSI